MNLHKCNYCNNVFNGTRADAIDAGWSFVDIRAPNRVYLKCCLMHFNELKLDILKATKGNIKTKWSND